MAAPDPRSAPAGDDVSGGIRLSIPLLFVVTEDWYFCSHRLPVARAARAAGASVSVAARVERHAGAITAEGFALLPLPWRRRSRNLWNEAVAFARVVRYMRAHRGGVVHFVAMKPTLYGAVASLLAPGCRRVFAIAGMGYVGTSDRPAARLLRVVYRFVFRRLVDRPATAVIVQNADDAEALARDALVARDRVRVIRGSGVDLDRFAPSAEPQGPITATFAGRMLYSKGILELVAASRIMRSRGTEVRVVLAGAPDPDNPGSIAAPRLRRWHDEGLIDYRGPVDDMAAQWRDTHIAVLPSHREGLPKTLLEAGASARPSVATDVPGCRELVRNGETGVLVPPRDPAALADAIERLARDESLRRSMGARARARVAAEFGDERVARETLAVYAALEGRAR